MTRFYGGLTIILQLLIHFNSQVNTLNVNESYCLSLQEYCTRCSNYIKSDYRTCENGGVLYGSRCQCPTEFTGMYCETRITVPECKCRNGGQCYQDICICSSEFTGMYCETRITTPECNCRNGGQCYQDICICSSEFTGMYCETRITTPECNCINGGQCYNGRCRCGHGFTGTQCETKLPEIRDDCMCQNGGVCNDDGCQCPSSSTGMYCESKIQLPVYECRCENGGRCYNGRCRCLDGYTGRHCESVITIPECRCKNGGKCYAGGCQCRSGFTGMYCETKIQLAFDCRCENGGQCHSDRCYCMTGYTGRHCESMIPMRLECKCQNGGKCYNRGCHCSPEFTGMYCETRVGCATQLIYDDARQNYINPPNCLPVCNKPEIKHPLYEVKSHYITSNKRHMLTKFELQCAHGYTLSGSSTLNCVSNDQWHQSLPQCHATSNLNENVDESKSIDSPFAFYYSIKCSDPGTPLNGMRTESESSHLSEKFAIGTTITFSCYPGYSLEGNQLINCTYYGTWSSGIPRCVLATSVHTAVRCSQPPVINNGRYLIIHRDLIYSSNKRYTQGYTNVNVGDQSTAKPGDIVRYSCNEGYEMVGSAEIECFYNGQWRTQIPTCKTSCGIYPGYNMYSKVSSAPWHFSLYKNEYDSKILVCGATLINHYYLITAASCVTYERTRGLLPYSMLKVHHGNYQEVSSSQEYQIKRVILNNNYDENNQDSDIALIELDRPVSFADHIHPICLPDISDPRQIMYHEIPERTTGIATGLGSPEGSSVSQLLKQFVMTVINRTYCQQQLDRYAVFKVTVSNNMFCAVGQMPEGSGACLGDGGGSFAVSKDNKFVLYGLISMGRPNCEPQYTIFINVAKYLTWIKTAISIV